ncbi:MAG TPA: hypothetical protein VMS98_04430 [Thermoanaerobaculia bacterium]|nr:hypothetical protein [Thermoanaerobaculia bacterium]
MARRILMYAMVDRLANAIPSFNQFYMAGLMTAAMVIIELVVMSGMYHDKRGAPHRLTPYHGTACRERTRTICR